MKFFLTTAIMSISLTAFASSVKKLECTNLPNSYFQGVKALEVVDNYETRYRSHIVIYQDETKRIHGSSYMGQKQKNAPYMDLENSPAYRNTYDFNINGITLRLRADGVEAESIHGSWYVDPLGDYGIDVVYIDCQEL